MSKAQPIRKSSTARSSLEADIDLGKFARAARICLVKQI
jgi:hypothetical protein